MPKAPEVKEPQVAQQLTNLNHAIVDLHNILRQLEKRLEPVIRDRKPTAEGSVEDMTGVVPLAQSLHALMRGVDDEVRFVHNLLDRMEI